MLTPGGLLVLGGAPKVGKSDLLIVWLVHMAAGVPFLGFTPPRPLRIFYLQAEIQYHYLRERMQQIGLPPGLVAAARDNLVVTPKLKMLLDAEGSARVAAAIRAAFPDDPLDILCIDPIRNLFDGGPDGGGRERQRRDDVLPQGPGRGAARPRQPRLRRDPRPPHQEALEAPGEGGSFPRTLGRQRAQGLLHDGFDPAPAG
ncbi:AAA family ATPase [Jhaorihella thermophila]